MHVTVWRQPSPRTAWTVSHLHAVSDFITHVVYVHVLKRYKREVRIYGDHCTVVVVRFVPPFGTPCLLGVLASEAQALLARSLYAVAAESSLSVRHERAADKLIPI